MREIVLDTETTGLDPFRGDRLIEIAGLELQDRLPTGRTFHVYVNPERDVPAEAFAIHGISTEFLKDKPLFGEIADSFLDFVDGAQLVIHNAAFDTGFLNAELEKASRPLLFRDRIVDTLMLARRRWPAGPNNLDALCDRFGIDRTKRDKHGALVDVELLADVYIELIGGRQTTFGLDPVVRTASGPAADRARITTRPVPLSARLDAETVDRHRAFVAGLGKAEPLWSAYLSDEIKKPVS
jgi:DNA polymerase-3 subunit epsilon